MSRVSPTLEGFRAAFRWPSLTFAEIAWRWTVGAVAWTLLFFWFIEYLDTLPVTNGDLTLLWTRQPLLVARAIAHILRGSLNRAVVAGLLAALALSLLWITAASIGRAATVRALLDYFAERKEAASSVSSEARDATEPRPLRSLIGLNILRVALTLAALLAFVGAAILVNLASSGTNPQPGLAFFLFLPLAGSICLVWPALNWVLSLACIFAVHDGEDALGALSAATAFFREHPGPVFAVSIWTGLAHLAALVGVFSLVSVPLAFIHIAPSRLVVAGVILVALVYFALADWLYMARLAGYVCIAEMPDVLGSSAPPVSPPSDQQLAPAPVQTSIDRDESILSDIPSGYLFPSSS
jgi:hypothetical protein